MSHIAFEGWICSTAIQVSVSFLSIICLFTEGAALPEGRSSVVGQGNLRITNVKRSDAGRYQCLLNLTKGSMETVATMSQSHTLVVYGKLRN